MAFDFKKEYKEYYLPAAAPSIVTVPAMSFIAVSGTGDPNDEDGVYKRAVGMLYAVAYTIKMSKKTDRRIDGYFDFVVPPLEGFWQQTGTADIDYSRKSDFMWTSVIRLPDFVTAEDFRWAVAEAERKKKLDLSPVEFLTIEEGLCVQCMHLGSYDTEPATVALMHKFAAQQGFEPDLTDLRRHHEIYLSDPRKTAPEKLKTVIRHPIRRKE
ncbi:MAG: GyrI-like domain-containing protein, partial [Ruminococcus sp.]|nr:GyrI-like domain-containing protein [Ruminococcus sp.]